MRESELLRRILNRSRGMAGAAGRWPRVLVGPGDDCAVVSVGNGEGAGAGLLVTVDQLVEGRHYAAGTPIDLVARKAVARSISDIAAMGGRPAWSLATGLLPEGFADGAALTDALHRWAEHWDAPMVGGDIATGPRGAPLVLTVMAAGTPHEARGPVLRSAARAGDELWVTGAFGGSLASGRHITFEPRVVEASRLCELLGEGLHAMIDISDGLGRDAARMAEASGVRFEIDAAALPRHADVADASRALGDGEDYELCFAAAPGAVGATREVHGTRLSRIGRVAAGCGCVANLGEDGSWVDVGDLGWDHGG